MSSDDPFARLTRTEPREAVASQMPMASMYRGTTKPLFWLAVRTSVLTLLTLGIYRFWEKTRLRKYFWSATAPGGDPMEYTGNGLEKLLGFLIAIAFLAVYLGLFQLMLFFAGLSLFSGGDSEEETLMQIGASYLTLIAVVPFVFYAQYRARRYILSRTRWRGVRFGVEPAAWGYVWRAMLHSLLTIITLGLLLPRQTFWLEKYKIDRTWYGNAQFVQNGRWQSLYPAMKHYFIAIAMIVVSLGVMGATAQPIWFIFTFVGVIWMGFGMVSYSVKTFRIMAEHKKLGDRVGFATEPRAGKVFWTWVLGTLLASACAGLVLAVFSNIAGGIVGFSIIDLVLEEGADLSSFEFGTAEFVGAGVLLVGYLSMLLAYGVFLKIFVSQPILEHYVQETRILNPAALDEIEQRSRDEMVEAEGFADALDVGAAI